MLTVPNKLCGRKVLIDTDLDIVVINTEVSLILRAPGSGPYRFQIWVE